MSPDRFILSHQAIRKSDKERKCRRGVGVEAGGRGGGGKDKSGRQRDRAFLPAGV